MRIDLFEFVEGLIRGIVYFFYNLIETSWQIIRHPFRGPLRLYRAHSKETQRQIGSLTLLFILLLVTGHFISLGQGSLDLAKMLSGPPRFDSQESWTLILGALVSTVIVDAALRGYFLLRIRRNRVRRHTVLAAVEYALAWPLLAIFLFTLFFDQILPQGSVPDDILLPGFLLAFLLGLIPAARLFRAGTAGQQAATSRAWIRGLRRAGGWLGVHLSLLFLLTAAVTLGDTTKSAIKSVAEAPAETEPEEPAARQLKAELILCRIWAAAPHVDIVLANKTDEAIIIYPYGELQVTLYDAEKGDFHLPLEAPEEYPTPVIFRPGDIQMLRLHVSREAAQMGAMFNACRIDSTQDPDEVQLIDWSGWPTLQEEEAKADGQAAEAVSDGLPVGENGVAVANQDAPVAEPSQEELDNLFGEQNSAADSPAENSDGE